MRIILYTGKGGVGKTSVAAATALRCAELGHKTVVVSTDTAHSLGDSLDVQLGPEPNPVRENLWAQEIDIHYSIEKHWGSVQKAMATVLAGQGVDKMVADELSILPGLEEGASLLWINQYVRDQAYDVVVIDAAPTAETLRLLSLPDVGRWWFERLFPIGRTARALAPIVRTLNPQGLDPSVLDAVERMFGQLGNVHKYLSDPALTSVRLVMNAERMVIKESQRTYTYLNLYGYTVDGVVCNRLIPGEVTDPYFAAWKESQLRNLALIEECFSPLPVLTAPLFSQEMGGLALLHGLGTALFGEQDPSSVLFEGRTHTIETTERGYYLVVPLPFPVGRDMNLVQSRDELTLRVGSYRRNFVLPRALWGLPATEAKYNGKALRILFPTLEPPHTGNRGLET